MNPEIYAACIRGLYGNGVRQLLLQDLHFTHISPDFLREAIGNNVIVQGNLPGGTSVTQPLNLHTNGLLKIKLNEALAQLPSDTNVNEVLLLKLVRQVWEQTCGNPTVHQKSWRLSGLQPFTRTALNNPKLDQKNHRTQHADVAAARASTDAAIAAAGDNVSDEMVAWVTERRQAEDTAPTRRRRAIHKELAAGAFWAEGLMTLTDDGALRKIEKYERKQADATRQEQLAAEAVARAVTDGAITSTQASGRGRPWKAIAQANEQQLANVQQHGDVYVNHRVTKAFGDDFFEGVVAQFKPPHAPGEAALWRVEYTDGDAEDLDLKELLQVLCPEDAPAPQRKKAKTAASHGGGGR